MLQPSAKTVPQRCVAEWAITSAHAYANPFADVAVTGLFTDPAGRCVTMPAFYAGAGTWKLRFAPSEPGRWSLRIVSQPHDSELTGELTLGVEPGDAPGSLRATPGQGWGWSDGSGKPVFVFGDTVYNLFGMAHCGYDVDAFLARRAAQGFNLLRVRLPVSPFHPPEGYSHWQNRRTWPWGGSEQKPDFSRFDLGYFNTVDRVVLRAEALGLGLELIMEAWGFEYPFNRRDEFTAEWEELWLRYLIARYDAYRCVSIWTLMNEYEFYPDGQFRYKAVADRWALRLARWVKATAPHGHVVALHNGPRLPPFAHRLRMDPQAVDAILFQDWGTRDAEQGWLAAGIEDVAAEALAGWQGSAILAEWGYERNPAFAPNMPSHSYCDREHTRRGAWRGVFSGLGIIHGFENSWGPWCKLDEDQPGLADLLVLRHFVAEQMPFQLLHPTRELVHCCQATPAGCRPLALATPEGDLVLAYLPAGGQVTLALPRPSPDYGAEWFDPCTGEFQPAECEAEGFFAAPGGEQGSHPKDWVLVLRA